MNKQWFKEVLVIVGAIHVISSVLGMMDVIHYRVYFGNEDKVIVSRSEHCPGGKP